jgi:hypothetical protein
MTGIRRIIVRAASLARRASVPDRTSVRSSSAFFRLAPPSVSGRTAAVKRRQRGAVGLLLMLLVVLTLGGALLVSTLGAASSRAAMSAETLAVAAAALAGHARAQRCTQGTGTVADHLPCPNTGAPEGVAAPSCGATTAIGRLPWKTLGLAPLRDAAGECLWYERSAAGARVIAPGVALAGQTRATVAGAAVCGGHYNAADYLEPSGGNDTSLLVPLSALALPGGCP